MIAGFRCRETEKIWNDQQSPAFPADIQRTARRKMILIDAANAWSDLRLPPGNHLEKLTGDRAGQFSIRVNDQWRICFTWGDDGNAYEVELVDYH